MKKEIEFLMDLKLVEEKKGFFSVDVPGFGVKYFNAVGKKILDLLMDGQMLQDVAKILLLDSQSNEQQVSKDLFEFLCDLKSIRIIKFDEKNIKSLLNLEEDEDIAVAGELTYSEIASYIRDNIRQKTAMLVNDKQRALYNDYSFRMRCFTHKEICYYSKKNDMVVNLLSVENMEDSSKVVNLILVVFKDELDFSKIMNRLLQDAKYWKKRKIRMSLHQNKLNDSIKLILDKYDFELEAILKEEYDDGDLIMYSKWI